MVSVGKMACASRIEDACVSVLCFKNFMVKIAFWRGVGMFCYIDFSKLEHDDYDK